MATNWDYTPLVGDFSAKSFQIGVNTIPRTFIPRSTDPDRQGNPRPGRLKWGLLLSNSNPTVNPQDPLSATCVVRSPFPATTPFIGQQNSVMPLVSATPVNNSFYTQQVTVVPIITLDVATIVGFDPSAAGILDDNFLYTVVLFQLGNPLPAPVGFELVIDYSHSAIN